MLLGGGTIRSHNHRSLRDAMVASVAAHCLGVLVLSVFAGEDPIPEEVPLQVALLVLEEEAERNDPNRPDGIKDADATHQRDDDGTDSPDNDPSGDQPQDQSTPLDPMKSEDLEELDHLLDPPNKAEESLVYLQSDALLEHANPDAAYISDRDGFSEREGRSDATIREASSVALTGRRPIDGNKPTDADTNHQRSPSPTKTEGVPRREQLAEAQEQKESGQRQDTTGDWRDAADRPALLAQDSLPAGPEPTDLLLAERTASTGAREAEAGSNQETQQFVDSPSDVPNPRDPQQAAGAAISGGIKQVQGTISTTGATGSSGSNQVAPDEFEIDVNAMLGTREHALGTWCRELDEVLRDRWDPGAGLLAARQGSTELVFRVGKSGRISHAQVLRSSGSAALDASALAALPKRVPPPRATDADSMLVKYTFRTRGN